MTISIRPPFTRETALAKVRAAEDAWNSRDPVRVSLAYSTDSIWRNRDQFLSGRRQIQEFLAGKWQRELDYRLTKALWAFDERRIAVRFQYEWHNDSGQWFRSYGNELWEFDDDGLMRRREASINDVSIAENDRKFFWPAPGPRPADHPGIPDVGTTHPEHRSVCARIAAQPGGVDRSRTFANGKGESMTKQETPQVIGVRHVGLSARDPAALAAFYRDVLGLQVVGGSTAETSEFGPTAFLSSRPAEESHDLAIFADPAFQHTAFKVASLADLRAFYQRVIGRGVPVRMAFNHGVSLAFYFDDPEGRLVEVYWPTGVACRQPHGDPLDLTLSEEALRRDVAEMAARAGAPSPAGDADPGRW